MQVGSVPTASTELTMRVTRNSALLDVPYETQVGVESNHTDMVKFDIDEDATYCTVVTHLEKCLDRISNGTTVCMSYIAH